MRLANLVRYLKRNDGAAAVELAIWMLVMVPALANVIDLGLYLYSGVQVGNAAQSGAQAAWTTCYGKYTFTTSSKPSDCTGLTNAVTYAITNSSVLGGSGAITETSTSNPAANEEYGMYCSYTGALVKTTTGSCTHGTPGYYYKVQATYADYSPLVRGVTISNFLSPPTRYAWARLQ